MRQPDIIAAGIFEEHKASVPAKAQEIVRYFQESIDGLNHSIQTVGTLIDISSTQQTIAQLTTARDVFQKAAKYGYNVIQPRDLQKLEQVYTTLQETLPNGSDAYSKGIEGFIYMINSINLTEQQRGSSLG